MAEHLPLAGLNIVVTRPRGQSTYLASAVEKLGGRCIQFPLLEITPLADSQPLLAIATQLQAYQLAIFISPNAVGYGMAAIQRAGGLPATLLVATVGAGSARALQELGVKNIIVPQQQFDSEALLAMPQLQQVKNHHVLIFRGDHGRELLGNTLKLRGAHVEYVSCYHRGKPQQDVSVLMASKPDALCVSSTEALNNLEEMLDTADKIQLKAIHLFVSHERIASRAHQLGWQQIETVSADDDNLLSRLTQWAEQEQGNTT